MKIKSYYRLLISTLICLGMKTNLFAQENNKSYDEHIYNIMGFNEKIYVGSETKDSSWSFDEWSREKNVVVLNLAATGAVVAMGLASWGYCSSSFHFEDEGWFDPDTKFGGADKLGHAYSGYVLTNVYNAIYKNWGYSDEQAIMGGVLSGWSQMTLIEIFDGFSDEQGLSWQDEVMNTAGVGLAYLRYQYPTLKEKFDFRMEWFPSPALRDGDWTSPFTDYSGQKYLIALKPDGFLKTGNPILKALEIHLGYYTRGYKEKQRYFSSENRYAYVGIGLNMTYVIEKLTSHRAWGVFDYFQIPFTDVPFSSKLD